MKLFCIKKNNMQKIIAFIMNTYRGEIFHESN